MEAVAQRCSVKKVFLEISQNSLEGTCVRFSFLIKLQASGLQLSLKKQLRHRCFPINFLKFLRTPFLMEHLWWLLLNLATFWCLFIKIEIEIVLRFSKITIKCCRKYHFALHFLVLPYFKKFFTLTYCKIFLLLCNFWFCLYMINGGSFWTKSFI